MEFKFKNFEEIKDHKSIQIMRSINTQINLLKKLQIILKILAIIK